MLWSSSHVRGNYYGTAPAATTGQDSCRTDPVQGKAVIQWTREQRTPGAGDAEQ
jgi:hypothetical protein